MHHRNIHRTVPSVHTCINFDTLNIIILKYITICNDRDRQCCRNICNLTPLSWISWSVCNSSASYRAWLQKPIKIEWKKKITHTKLQKYHLELKVLNFWSNLVYSFSFHFFQLMQYNSISFLSFSFSLM